MNLTQSLVTAPVARKGVAQLDEALDRLAHADRDARQAAALNVGEIADPAAAPGLVARLWSEPDPFVRETLSWAITRVAAAATPLLLEALTSARAATLDRALHVLSKIADPATVDAMIPLADDADPHVAAKARWALARIGDPRAIPAFVAHLGVGDDTTRNGVTRDLASFAARAVPALVDALTSDKTHVRSHAAEALCFMGPGAEGATDVLSGALDDPDGEVRVSAAMALFDLRTPRAHAALTRRTKTADRRVRAIADRAARRPGGP
ncbi:HEAT repeat domain-containing protein [Xylanimonas allomyrinae]|uniref:HEAT repeat domain-containing protein n=1 Tax=Xylanimonas allomyrinae TaxID=2509459 RepID=A0A4P6EML2_9MICO|nr:HEAT repeat domain-containing protein [Xylanimonas allomyrinae]QAY62993.1 HEAT repeat domain-containing protein [Xylanimonas allomyrinae]